MGQQIRTYTIAALGLLLVMNGRGASAQKIDTLRQLPALAVGVIGVSDSQAKSLIKWRSENDWDSDNRKTDGRTMLGFTHQRHKDGSLPRWDHWCKLLEQGRATYDKEPFDYWFWYELKVNVAFEWESSWSNMEWLQKMADGLKNARFVDIGDKAITNDSECYVIKGPIRIDASIGLKFDKGDWLWGDGVGWAIPYNPIPEKDQLTSKKDRFFAQRTDVMLEMVRNILANSSGKAAAPPKKPSAKPLAKPVASPQKGAPGLTLTASPTGLWADGKSTSKLTFTARDNNGRPIKGSFDISVASGKCSHIKFLTDANGTASATYKAPEQPGEDTVTVSGGGQKTSLTIRLGGMKLVPEDKNLTQLFADGKTKIGLVVMGGDPSFAPLAGAKVKLTLNEKELPVKGALSAQSVIIGKDGLARFTYSPPNVYGAKGNFRRGNVYITATASIGKPARVIQAVYRVPVYGGEVYYLSMDKVGFKSVSNISVPAPNRNGVLTGSVVGQAGGNDTVPVASADLTLTDAKGKTVGRGASDSDGQFKLEFVGDPMSNTGQSMEMNEPVKMSMDADTVRVLTEWKADLDTLEKAKYDVYSLKEFASDLPKNLAGSVVGAKNPLGSTEYLVYTMSRLAWTCRYVKLLDDRQMESADWFLESLTGVTATVADFAGVSDKLQSTAKDKLKKRFKPDTWKKFEDNLLREFLDTLYQQLQKGYDTAKALNYNTEPVDAFKKYGADYATKKGIEGLSASLKKGFQGGVHNSSQKILSDSGSRAMRGQMSTESPAGDLAAAKETFTTFEKQHNAQNIDHLNRELYRLDAKFFADTVIKGPFMYLKLKKLVLDPEALAGIAALDTASIEKLQDDLTGTSDSVGKVVSAFDATFQAYQGYTWVADFYSAGGVKEKIRDILVE